MTGSNTRPPTAFVNPRAERSAVPLPAAVDARGVLRLLRPYLIGAAALPVVVALYWGQGVLIPLAVAGLLAFLLSPMVSALERAGLGRLRTGRVAAVILVVCLVFSVLGGVGWVITQQGLALASELPRYKGNLMRKVSDLRGAREHGPLAQAQSAAKEVMGELQKEPLGKGEAKPLPVVVKGESGGIWQIPRILEGLGAGSFVVVLVIFMLIERHEIRNRLIRLTGHGRLAGVTRGLDDAAGRISRYLMAQTMLNLAYGAALGAGLFFIGVPYAVMWGFLAFVLRFIPYLGVLMAAAGTIALSLAVFSDWQRPLITVALFVVVELLTYMVIEPLLYGHTTGVSPVALFVSLAFWTWLWGPVGLALGTPLTVCLVVLGKHVPALGFLTVMMTDEPALRTDVSYYQRLLAKDSAEGTQILDDYHAQHPLEQVYDDILISALSRAKRDRMAQRMSEQELRALYQAARETIEKLADRRAPSDAESEEALTVRLGDSTPRVLACAAGDEGDEIALMMLSRLLSPADCTMELAPANALSGEIVSLATERKPALALIVALRPGGLAQTRHLCKRLRAGFPGIKILVGRWGGGDHDPGDREMLLAAGADEVGATLRQSRDQLLERVRRA